ncbi:hypothetical protein LTR27_009720 [Elasticomyces elasticus]|nr:hypothetical protein LTR27_009720 [Elasticomyces elasticus]
MSRLLALPPELRVLIYEYLFTIKPRQQIELISIPELGPSLALIITCRLVYNETLDLANQAFAHFCTQHTFYVELSQIPYRHYPPNPLPPELCKMAMKVARMPRLPVSEIELRYLEVVDEKEKRRHKVVAKALGPREFEAMHEATHEYIVERRGSCCGYHAMEEGTRFAVVAARMGWSLVQRQGSRYIDAGSLVKTMLAILGWSKGDIESAC